VNGPHEETRARTQAPLPTAAIAASSTSPDDIGREVSHLFRRDSLYMLLWTLPLIGAAGLTPVMTRIMGTAEFGAAASASTVMQVLFIVAGLGLHTAIQRHYGGSNGPVDAHKLLTLSIVVSTSIIATVDVAGRWWAPHLGFDHYGGALRMAVLWAGLMAVTSSGLSLLRSQDRLLPFSTVSLLQSVGTEATSLVLVARVGPSASNFILGRLLVQIAAATLVLLLAQPKTLRVRDRGLVRAGLVYGVPLVPAVLCMFVLDSADRLIVQSELGQTAVARYQIAYNIGSAPILLLYFLSTNWMPRFFALGDGARRAAVLADSRDGLYRLLSPVVVGLSLGAPIVLRLWAPAEYHPEQLLFVTSLVIVSAVPYAAGLAATRGLMAAGRTATIAVAALAAAVANIGLNLALVPRFGLIGSAAATAAAYCLLHVLLLPRARVVTPTPATSPALLAQLAAAVAVAIAAAALPDSPAFLLVRGLLVLATVVWFGRVLWEVGTRRSPAARSHQKPWTAGPAPASRGLVLPHQRGRHPAPAADQLPPAGQQVRPLPRRGSAPR
jgi:O-antigen/teichoic acid export membrane protein